MVASPSKVASPKQVSPKAAALNDSQAKKIDLIAELQADRDVRVQRQMQAQNKSQLNISFDKYSSTLSVKIVNQQSGQFIRQINYTGYHAMRFTSHGLKGTYIDASAWTARVVWVAFSINLDPATRK